MNELQLSNDLTTIETEIKRRKRNERTKKSKRGNNNRIT